MTDQVPVRREDRSVERQPGAWWERPVRWEPFEMFEDLWERMNQLMDATWRLGPAGTWAPLVDVEELDDAYVIELDAPGVRREDVTVEVRGGDLCVSGEHTERERSGVLRRKTRRTGRFYYRTNLPEDVDEERIEAKLADGVLTVHLPKREQSKPRRITVT